MNFTDAIEIFLRTLTMIQHRSARTIAAYRNNLKQFQESMEAIGIYRPADVKPQHIDDFLSRRVGNFSSSSVNQMISTLRHFYLDYCFEHQTMNPTLLLRVQKRSRRLPEVMDEKETQLFLSIPLERNADILRKAIFELMYSSGLRVSECVGLQMNHLHLNQKIIQFVGKGDKERMVVIHAFAIDALRAYLNQVRPLYLGKKMSSYVFVNEKGKPISREQVYRLVKHRIQEIGLPKNITPHSLRHTFATHLLEEGANLVTIQELLGHSDISTTQIYTHLQTNKLHEAYDTFHPRGRKSLDEEQGQKKEEESQVEDTYKVLGDKKVDIK